MPVLIQLFLLMKSFLETSVYFSIKTNKFIPLFRSIDEFELRGCASTLNPANHRLLINTLSLTCSLDISWQIFAHQLSTFGFFATLYFSSPLPAPSGVVPNRHLVGRTLDLFRVVGVKNGDSKIRKLSHSSPPPHIHFIL